MKKLFFCKWLLSSLCFVFFLNSCIKDAVDESNYVNVEFEQTKVLETLLSWGYLKEDIMDEGEFYIVEGDMVFFKNKEYSLNKEVQINSRSKTQNKGLKDEMDIQSQYYTGYLVSNHLTETIKVWRGGLQSNWGQAMLTGMLNWNAVCGVRFVTASSITDADVVVTNVNVPGAYAAAEFPSNGEAGFRIRIDDSFDNLTLPQKVLITTHELGHIIGFRHTDTKAIGETASGVLNGASFSQVYINGTIPVDNSSIMNHDIGGNSYSGFSFYDKIAARNLYPKPLAMSPGYVSLNSMNIGQTITISGVGSVKVTLSGDSGVYLDNGSGFRTTLNLTAPTTFTVVAPFIGPGYGSRLSTVWLRKPDNAVIDHSDVNHSN